MKKRSVVHGRPEGNDVNVESQKAVIAEQVESLTERQDCWIARPIEFVALEERIIGHLGDALSVNAVHYPPDK